MQENLLKEILNPITIIIILMGENCINAICNHETHGHEHEEGAIIKPTSVNLITRGEQTYDLNSRYRYQTNHTIKY